MDLGVPALGKRQVFDWVCELDYRLFALDQQDTGRAEHHFLRLLGHPVTPSPEAEPACLSLILISKQSPALTPPHSVRSLLLPSHPYLAAPNSQEFTGQARFKQADAIQTVSSHLAVLGRRASGYTSL